MSNLRVSLGLTLPPGVKQDASPLRGTSQTNAVASARPRLLRPQWDAAVATCLSQLDKLEIAFTRHGNPQAAAIARTGFAELRGWLQSGLGAQVATFDQSADATDRGRAAGALKSGVDVFARRLDADRVLDLLETNPCGVLVTIRGSLHRVLDEIRSQVRA